MLTYLFLRTVSFNSFWFTVKIFNPNLSVENIFVKKSCVNSPYSVAYVPETISTYSVSGCNLLVLTSASEEILFSSGYVLVKISLNPKIKDLDVNIKGKDVLIVEDIIDSGYTLSKLVKLLSARDPASIKICTMLDKPSRRVVDFLSGSAYALSCKLKKVANNTFIIVPNSTDISGELLLDDFGEENYFI